MVQRSSACTGKSYKMMRKPAQLPGELEAVGSQGILG